MEIEENKQLYNKFIRNDIATFSRDIDVLRSLIRYQNCNRLVNESVAEHSFYVAFKVYELGYKFGIDNNRIAKAAKIALCHDCGEIYTGDLPHSLKMYSPEIKKIAENLEVELISENFKFFADDFKSFANRDDEIVCTLVEAADCLDVIMFIDREEQLGNKDEDIFQIRAESSERFINLTNKLKNLIEKENKQYE